MKTAKDIRQAGFIHGCEAAQFCVASLPASLEARYDAILVAAHAEDSVSRQTMAFAFLAGEIDDRPDAQWCWEQFNKAVELGIEAGAIDRARASFDAINIELRRLWQISQFDDRNSPSLHDAVRSWVRELGNESPVTLTRKLAATLCVRISDASVLLFSAGCLGRISSSALENVDSSPTLAGSGDRVTHL